MPQRTAPPIMPTLALVRTNSVFSCPKIPPTRANEKAVGKSARQAPANKRVRWMPLASSLAVFIKRSSVLLSQSRPEGRDCLSLHYYDFNGVHWPLFSDELSTASIKRMPKIGRASCRERREGRSDNERRREKE